MLTQTAERPKLTAFDYRNALLAQSAVNLSGLVHTFSEVLPRIWEEARAEGKGTDFVNNHPIARLYSEQIAFLSSGRDYSDAHKVCEELSKKEVAKPKAKRTRAAKPKLSPVTAEDLKSGPFTIVLESMGNPDFNQYAPISDPETVTRATLKEIVAAAEDYRDKWQLGGGNWPCPAITKAGRPVAWISYNGRLWDSQKFGTAKEIVLKDLGL